MKGKIFIWSFAFIVLIFFTTVFVSGQSFSNGFFTSYQSSKADDFLSLLVGSWENSNIDEPEKRLISRIELNEDGDGLKILLYVNIEHTALPDSIIDNPLELRAVPFRINEDEDKARKFTTEFNNDLFIVTVDGVRPMHALNIDFSISYRNPRFSRRNLSKTEEFHKVIDDSYQ